MPLVDAFGELLSRLVEAKFRLLADAPHIPRVTINQRVVSRESWSILPSALEFADAKDDAARFLGARAWARARGIPRFAYAKSALEEKPMYVDFDAPALVNVLARLARRAREDAAGEKVIVLSEMLPTLDQTWLTDAAGKRFTSELRMICVDGAERTP